MIFNHFRAADFAPLNAGRRVNGIGWIYVEILLISGKIRQSRGQS
jgi:hypothetical protein